MYLIITFGKPLLFSHSLDTGNGYTVCQQKSSIGLNAVHQQIVNASITPRNKITIFRSIFEKFKAFRTVGTETSKLKAEDQVLFCS